MSLKSIYRKYNILSGLWANSSTLVQNLSSEHQFCRYPHWYEARGQKQSAHVNQLLDSMSEERQRAYLCTCYIHCSLHWPTAKNGSISHFLTFLTKSMWFCCYYTIKHPRVRYVSPVFSTLWITFSALPDVFPFSERASGCGCLQQIAV